MITKPLFLLNVAILTLGCCSGIFFGSRTNFDQEQDVVPNVQTRARFQSTREAKAFGQGEFDFYSKLASSNVDYQRELSKLLKQNVSYEMGNRDKLWLLFTQWGYDSPFSALVALDQLPFDERSFCRSNIFEGWAEKNPQALAKYYQENKDILYQSDALALSMKSWADSDLNGALVFLASLKPGEIKEGFEAILSAVPSSQPDRFRKVVSQFPKHVLEDVDFLGQTMSRWVRLSPADAMEWMQTLPSDKQELFSQYKGVEELPPLDSLCEKFDVNTRELVTLLHQYPQVMQNEVWTTVAQDIQDRKGNMEATKWQMKNMPDEIVMATIRNGKNKVFSTKTEEDNPVLYEQMIIEAGKKEADYASLSIIVNTYIDRFGSYDPQRVLSQYEKRQGVQKTLKFSVSLLSSWIYDKPEEALPWIDGRVNSLDEKDKTTILQELKKKKTVMAVKK